MIDRLSASYVRTALCACVLLTLQVAGPATAVQLGTPVSAPAFDQSSATLGSIGTPVIGNHLLNGAVTGGNLVPEPGNAVTVCFPDARASTTRTLVVTTHSCSNPADNRTQYVQFPAGIPDGLEH